MRNLYLRCLAPAIVIVLAGIAHAQFPGGGGAGGPGGAPDPGFLFDMLAKGQPALTKEMLPGRMQDRWEAFSNGKTSLTRDEFVVGAKAAFEQMKQSGGSFSGKGGGGFGGKGGGAGGGNPADIDKMVEDNFRRRDKDGDGFISYEEMDDRLREVKDKYDTNHDGFLSLDEYRAYFKDRMAERQAQNGQNHDPSKDAPSAELSLIPQGSTEEEARPKFQRAGKLSKDLPEWFVLMDKNGDNDGQVAFYEWRKSDRPANEFVTWDLNDDGYITPEEVLKVLKVNKDAVAKAEGHTHSASAAMNPGSGEDSTVIINPAAFNPAGKNGFPGRGNKGGDQGGGGFDRGSFAKGGFGKGGGDTGGAPDMAKSRAGRGGKGGSPDDSTGKADMGGKGKGGQGGRGNKGGNAKDGN